MLAGQTVTLSTGTATLVESLVPWAADRIPQHGANGWFIVAFTGSDADEIGATTVGIETHNVEIRLLANQSQIPNVGQRDALALAYLVRTRMCTGRITGTCAYGNYLGYAITDLGGGWLDVTVRVDIQSEAPTT